MLRRLIARMNTRTQRGIDLRLAHAGLPMVRITSSVSPLPVRGWDVNPRYSCCRHCETWAPADCPVPHDEPCPDCQDAS